MDDRHRGTATIVSSQLPVDAWHATIGDQDLADAILDRLVHNAHRVEGRSSCAKPPPRPPRLTGSAA